MLSATCTETRNDQNTQAAPLNTHATPTITMPAARVQFPGAYFLSNSYVNRQKNTSPGTCPTACSTFPHSMHMHNTHSQKSIAIIVVSLQCTPQIVISYNTVGNKERAIHMCGPCNHSLRLLETDKRASLESST